MKTNDVFEETPLFVSGCLLNVFVLRSRHTLQHRTLCSGDGSQHSRLCSGVALSVNTTSTVL